MTGNWEITNIVPGPDMPQKIATAVSELNETMIGADYEAIAYIGEQVVNGINHAVLAKQILTTGRDTENIVLLIFNEKPGEIKLTLSAVERVLEGGFEFGGVDIDVNNVPDEVRDALTGFVGSNIEPVMLLATQVVHGINFYVLAKSTPVVPDAKAKAVIMKINTEQELVSFIDILANKEDNSLGYAFTWMANNRFGKPLGEWP